MQSPTHPSYTAHLTFPDPVTALEEAICHHVRYSLGKAWQSLSRQDLFIAVALAVRDRMVDTMFDTAARYRKANAKRLYYLSMEFLLGRLLGTNLLNLGLLELCHETLLRMGVDLEELRESETDPALGNGGLGRLAACFLDSMATLGIPGYGYGINYDYGLFRQEIANGYQKEHPDHWRAHGNVWQIERPDEACLVPLYGRIDYAQGKPRWVDWRVVVGLPADIPVVGYGGRTVNYLRLFSARASDEFDMQIFHQGDYLRAVEQKVASEMITKVLYPSDAVEAGRELRLVQEYFLVACAMQDIFRRYLKSHVSFEALPTQVAVQLNDTHPALAIAECMRLLVDEHDLPWEHAWELTQACMAYTNHTLLPEALEKWPVALLEYVLPRHLHIIYDINARFLKQVAVAWPGDLARLQRLSFIEEAPQKHVRMAHLAVVGSHAVNGVAALHSELLKTALMPDFYQLWPERFSNKTNGVTQRRWLLKANPGLAHLVSQTLGSGWITCLDELQALEPYAQEHGFQQAFMAIKQANKARLARVIQETTQVVVDPQALFDIHVKRIHEYKRQLLNVMRIIYEYLRLVEDQVPPAVPRTYIFAGKAAPGYWAAKQIIKLINNVSQVINNDPRVGGQIKVVFLPDYRVLLAEKIIPAADVSEQISTAGTEASGTSNMKFAMNGALTVGTLDGANIEMLEEVGKDNIFIFGLKAAEIHELRAQGGYDPQAYYHRYPQLQRVLEALESSRFCPHEPGLFTWIVQSMLQGGDHYFHLPDLLSYLEIQQVVGEEFQRPALWARKAILNVARIGKFSSDRTVLEYARDIWQVQQF
ncbi:MAG: glycogen/starch/alpha-glucan phosphorylase [Candidatus Tectimicrobiota bacterium]